MLLIIALGACAGDRDFEFSIAIVPATNVVLVNGGAYVDDVIYRAPSYEAGKRQLTLTISVSSMDGSMATTELAPGVCEQRFASDGLGAVLEETLNLAVVPSTLEVVVSGMRCIGEQRTIIAI